MNKISVIMSAFNCENTIEKSINSILNQTYENFEFLIADDNSTDHTSEIIKNMKKNDSRIMFYQNTKNIGLTKSLNKLLSISSGSFIARQDADDVSMNHRLETQLAKLNELDLDFITSRAQIIGSERLIPGFTFNFPTSFDTTGIKMRIINAGGVSNYSETISRYTWVISVRWKISTNI